MKWQIRYALESFSKSLETSTAEHVREELIRVHTDDRPDVYAVISDAETIDEATARRYHKEEPNMDFLCGFRKTCVWEGDAISYLEGCEIGWGSFGTLCSGVDSGNANKSAHKVYFFADRLYRQTGKIQRIKREYDRVHTITLSNGKTLRIGMIAEYEPTADAVRSLWQRFGPMDVILDINPNGSPTKSALEAGRELGCEVLKWDGLKSLMQRN